MNPLLTAPPAARTPAAEQGETSATASSPAPAGAELPKRILIIEEGLSARQRIETEVRERQCRWELAFAKDEAAALERLGTMLFDAVVARLHPSPAEGIEFLNTVAKRDKTLLRFVRCNPEDRNTLRTCQGTPPAYIPQDIDAQALVETVHRSFHLSDWLAEAGTSRMLGRIKKLPTLPQSYTELTSMLQSPDVDFQAVACLIAKDPVMSAKILQLVNSAFFSFARQITEPREAVIMLGLQKTRALILLANVFSEYDRQRCAGLSMDGFWKHSAATADLARFIAVDVTSNEAAGDLAYTAGLLHDVGKLLMAGNLPDDYARVLRKAGQLRCHAHEAEREFLATTHADLGACLLGVWALPLPILEAVAFHHCPNRAPRVEFSPLAAVHIANALEHARNGQSIADPASLLDYEYVESLGLLQQLANWRNPSGARAAA